MEKENYTAEELAALFNEIRTDEAAAKRDDAHSYGMDALRKSVDAKAKPQSTEKARDKGIER